MKYAADTKVSTEKSRSEIEATLKRYGAEGFAYLSHGSIVELGFTHNRRTVRFNMELPDRNDKRFTHHASGPRVTSAAAAAHEQACRQMFRALALGIKAKLEFIESGISSFEREFLAWVVVKDGRTVFEVIAPQLEDRAREMPLTLMDRIP